MSKKKKDYLPKAPRMQRLKTYDDGTAAVGIVRTKRSLQTQRLLLIRNSSAAAVIYCNYS